MTGNDRQEPSVADDNLLERALQLHRQMKAVIEALDVTDAAYGPHAEKDNQRGAFAHGRVSLAHDLRAIIDRASLPPHGGMKRPADPQPAARCRRPEGCVCGGDTPGVRAGCQHWSGR